MKNKIEKPRQDIFDRRGRFYVSEALLTNNLLGLQRVLSHMIVVRCEHQFGGVFDYIALSNMFDQVEPGGVVPEYSIEIDEDKNAIKARRIESGSFDHGVISKQVVERLENPKPVTIEVHDVAIKLK